MGQEDLQANFPLILEGKYLGIDIVPELLEFADKLSNRPDWRFVQVAENYSIPETDNCADMICSFSVFTHLLHEHSYLYLKNGFRTLKEGGNFIFSFLEFRMKSHWRVFESTVEAENTGLLNQFIEREGIEAWCEHIGFEIEGFYDGDKPHFPISEPIKLEDGQVFKTEGHLGQSVCVLRKPVLAS